LSPTTAGSGSEATHFAVVYIGHEKFSVAAPALYADHIILDPGLVRSGSKHQRAVSGIDAVCQSIESLWAVSGTEQSRRFARHALSILLKHIGRFVKRADTQSAHGMMIGSYLAGRAIDVSRTTAAHALSYAITKQYGISHGHAVALTLGAFIEGHAGIEAIQPILKAFRVNTAPEAAAKFREIVRSIGLPSSFTDAGITTPLQLQQIVASVNLERLSNNPVKFSLDEMTAMLERAA
jgi:alcohol dehydrogenase class IV